MNKKRVGRFYVSNEMIKNLSELGKALNQIEFIPVRVEYRYEINSFEYNGYCKHFYEVQEGIVIPEYDLRITTNIHGEFYYAEVVRRDES